jgi:hypothetical protein
MKYEELCLCTCMCRDSCNLNRIGRGMKLKLVAMQSRSGLIGIVIVRKLTVVGIIPYGCLFLRFFEHATRSIRCCFNFQTGLYAIALSLFLMC